MLKTRGMAAALAVLLIALSPSISAAFEKQDQNQSDERDGHSRNEGRSLSHVPLVLSSKETMRIASIVWMTQTLTYLSLTSFGVDVVSQDRVNLGGLGVLGGLFNPTYGADDFTAQNDIGTVFRAGKDKLAIALKGDLRLEDHRVVIFNTNSEYQVGGHPTIEQVPAEQLAKLGTIPLINQLLLHTIAPNALQLLTSLNQDPPADRVAAQDAGVDLVTHLPALQQLVVGRAYLGPNNTIMVVVRPASVVGDEGF